METEARSSSKDANTELAPKSGEGRRKVKRKAKQVGVKRKKKPKTQISTGQGPQHMCVQGLASNKIKPGKCRGQKALGMVGNRTL